MAEKVDHHTLNRRIRDQLRVLIESGAIPLGTRIDESTLATDMGVSRTPLREAIARLAEEGLVEHRAYRGNFVRMFTARQVHDLYEVRKTLEGLAMRLAVPKLTEDDVAMIRSVLDDAYTALRRGDMAGYSMADQRFHDTVAQLSENEILIDSLSRLRRQIHMIRSVANRDTDVVDRTARERSWILAALESRDTDLAVRLMEDHIDGVRRAVLARFGSVEARDAAPVASALA